MVSISRKQSVVLAILLLSIGAALVIGGGIATPFFLPSPNRSFTLTASGSAYDTVGQKNVDISLFLEGTARGSLDSSITLNVEGGAANVEGYLTTSASKGSGVITPKGENVNLQITMASSPYGGRSGLWSFTGKVTSVAGDKFSLELSASVAKLALQGSPTLRDLQLSGVLALA